MIMSDEDYESWSKAVLDAADKGEIDSIIGQEFTALDNIHMVPDILQNDDNYFFPVFTTMRRWESTESIFPRYSRISLKP